jgi:hypothetical protein
MRRSNAARELDVARSERHLSTGLRCRAEPVADRCVTDADPSIWCGSGTGSTSVAQDVVNRSRQLGRRLTGRLGEACQRIDLTQPYRPRGASTTRLTTATAGLMPWAGWFGRNVATNQICSMVGGPVASCSRTEGFWPWAAS